MRKLLISTALLVALAACGGVDGPKTIGPSAELPDSRCDDGLCVSDLVAAGLQDARSALETCRPDPEAEFGSDPSGLRLLEVELEEDRGAMWVEIVLANTGSSGIYEQPGTELEVVAGEARVAPENGLNPGDSARIQDYGVAACGTETHRYSLELEPGERATLEASALWDGDRVVETITIDVVRPRETQR